MSKQVSAPLSIVRQVTLLMLTLSVLGIGGMSLSLWMAHSMQGNAHAINKAGSLRMQSYRLLSRVPLGEDSAPLLSELERDQSSDDLQQLVQREHLAGRYLAMHDYWLTRLKPRLLQAQRPQDAAGEVGEFVRQLDALVSAIDQKTEHRLMLVAQVQKVEIVLSLLVLLGTIVYLRLRLLRPWRRLLRQANAVAAGDFSQRYPLPSGSGSRGHHEMDLLGLTLNSMSQSLSQMYAELEQRVSQKTADLQQKNRVLDYLYRTSRQLHNNQPLSRRLLPVLEELQAFTPLREIQIRLYESDGVDRLGDPALSAEPSANGQAAAIKSFKDRPAEPTADDHAPMAEIAHSPAGPAGDEDLQPLSWSLRDKLGNYGLVLARHPVRQPLDTAQQRLMATLIEQVTSTLALERQAEHRQQMLLMAERTAIAAELHDSIAQSLSCLKLQIGCLQMQSQDTAPENKLLMQQMREEMNTAYRQLRELLTTFRLTMTEPGLRAALKEAVDEFSAKLGFRIDFDYQLPAGTFTPHQVIHLIHISREALNNVLKHAHATRVSVTAGREGDETVLSICDNGRGLPDEQQRPHHYGLMIMRDRAAGLPGHCRAMRRPAGGTEVRVVVYPEPMTTEAPEEQVNRSHP
ncbi:nitrate/nitrite two-component system sensor histidine kinase NarX [Sodalis sp. dw_96]|uniref:nitrate/nitrite two-component system sensor histidine kinase NarX n=1 Tax=Sodalis sp. dw_96 TaxID=2719794 RepID=UPI001BD2D0B6|nr:nitrate/nitrite two-component system sensor histidine kinase NarX [Sodalis sp. dw_96]